jgi:catechol 2,3-dioxygenase
MVTRSTYSFLTSRLNMPNASGTLSDFAQLGPAYLRVTDVAKTTPLWVDIVGLTAVANGENSLDLGVAGRTLITLHGGARSSAPAKSVGLFHLALNLPSRLELARAASRLRRAGYSHSAQDHLVSESVYFSDRDGNGIELYFATPDRAWVQLVEGRPHFLTQDGVSHSGLEPLDMNRLLSEVDTHGDGDGSLPTETHVGHIHMRSNAPEIAMQFYSDVLGFKPHIASAVFGMFDCGTEANPHMIAFNIWGGRELPATPESSAGLSAFTIELPPAELDAVRDRFEGGTTASAWEAPTLVVDDPDGNRARLCPLRRSGTTH